MYINQRQKIVADENRFVWSNGISSNFYTKQTEIPNLHHFFYIVFHYLRFEFFKYCILMRPFFWKNSATSCLSQQTWLLDRKVHLLAFSFSFLLFLKFVVLWRVGCAEVIQMGISFSKAHNSLLRPDLIKCKHLVSEVTVDFFHIKPDHGLPLTLTKSCKFLI